MEEFISGRIISYDGIMNSKKEIIFDTSHIFPTPIMDIVNTQDHMVYYSAKKIDPKLRKMGRKAVRRFLEEAVSFTLSFSSFWKDKEGLGQTVIMSG